MTKHYTVAVRGRFFWKKHKVVDHGFESHASRCPIKTWMYLECADGSYVYVPEVDTKRWVVYPDYRDYLKHKETQASLNKLQPDLSVVPSEEMTAHALSITTTSITGSQAS